MEASTTTKEGAQTPFLRDVQQFCDAQCSWYCCAHICSLCKFHNPILSEIVGQDNTNVFLCFVLREMPKHEKCSSPEIFASCYESWSIGCKRNNLRECCRLLIIKGHQLSHTRCLRTKTQMKKSSSGAWLRLSFFLEQTKDKLPFALADFANTESGLLEKLHVL